MKLPKLYELLENTEIFGNKTIINLHGDIEIDGVSGLWWHGSIAKYYEYAVTRIILRPESDSAILEIRKEA
mgnify:CR=1 FL=1